MQTALSDHRGEGFVDPEAAANEKPSEFDTVLEMLRRAEAAGIDSLRVLQALDLTPSTVSELQARLRANPQSHGMGQR